MSEFVKLDQAPIGCFFCKGTNVDYSPMDIDLYQTWQKCACIDCNHIWYEIYTFTGIEWYEEDQPKKEDK